MTFSKPLGTWLISTTAVSLFLVGCNDSNSAPVLAPPPPPVTVTPPPAPPPPPPANFNVANCLNQIVVPGRTVANLVVPDVLQLNLAQPAGFPNGRRYQDPVIDVTLAVIFLDLTRHPATTFASVPVNPSGNDRPFATTFPFLPTPHGPQPVAAGGTGFDFRTEPASAFRRVDRAGMPAVATALIGGDPNKNSYNDDSPAIDATGKWVPELTSQLTALTNALADDLQRLNLTPCARPN